MNEAGFEYNPENVDEMFSRSFAGLSPVEYAEQWGFGMYTMMDPESDVPGPRAGLRLAERGDRQRLLSASEQNAWYEVNNDARTTPEKEDDPYRNPMVQQAIEDFYTDVENDPRVRDAKRPGACMEEAGHPFAERGGHVADNVYDEDCSNRVLRDRGVGTRLARTTPSGRQMVEQEIGVAVANATCPPLEEVAPGGRRRPPPRIRSRCGRRSTGASRR